jgi:hypothetical protein
MENEEKKRQRAYSYKRVKEPILAYLANRMTSAGATVLAWTDDVAFEVIALLEKIYQKIKRLGGMPDDWNSDSCVEEILADGLLTRVDEQLRFMHQSVQEYFTGHHFYNTRPEALVEFTPKLSWEQVRDYTDAFEVPSHRFAQPLLMMAGLLDDCTTIVAALAERNPVLAAAAISSGQPH